MSTLFISHSHSDNIAALAVASWLKENGWDDYFLDVEPARGLTPGERWQEALKAAADRCEGVLFLISPAWRDSRWCLAEFLLAKQLGKVIFGVLVEETSLDTLPKEMTAEWQLCDLVAGTARRAFRVDHDPIPVTEVSFGESGLQRLKLGLQKAAFGAASFAWPPPQDPDRSPYRGLKPLEIEDAAVFFGREAAVVRGLDTLRGIRERGVEGMLVILGASGSGKSSFLRAGLWPRLSRDDRTFFPLPVIRPERAVISGSAGLAASLEKAYREVNLARSRSDIGKALRESGGLGAVLDEIQQSIRSRLEPDAPPPTIVIPIDQAEELWSADGRGEALEFLSLLGQTLAPPESVNIQAVEERRRALTIIAVRSDSYERLQTEPRLGRIRPSLLSLSPMSSAEFKAVIEGPATRATAAGRKLIVEPALTERLLEDGQGPDALPLLAFTLERMLVEHGGDGDLRLSEYEALGGVRGSIEAAINAAFAFDARGGPEDCGERERILRRGFIPWLVAIDPETDERKRRVASWDDIPVDARPLLDRLVEQRLLIRDRRRGGGGAETAIVEVAHEALLRQWTTLRTWLDQDADALRALDAVKRAAEQWVKNGRGEAWLVHTSERLRAAEALRERPDFDRVLGEVGAEYVGACRARDEIVRAERLSHQKRIGRARFLVGLTLLLIGVAGVGFWVGVRGRGEARHQAERATRTAAQADFDLATLYLARGEKDTPTAVAHLTRVLRSQPVRGRCPPAGVAVARFADGPCHRRFCRRRAKCRRWRSARTAR